MKKSIEAIDIDLSSIADPNIRSIIVQLLNIIEYQAQENTVLKEENQKLREALENEEKLRTEALNRIDALLRKIQEHDSVE